MLELCANACFLCLCTVRTHAQCDGVDLTPKIKELKLHCLLFLNIHRYVKVMYSFLCIMRDVMAGCRFTS